MSTRLTRRYANMTDEKLRLRAGTLDRLSELERVTLLEEVSTRRLSLDAPPAVESVPAAAPVAKRVISFVLENPPPKRKPNRRVAPLINLDLPDTDTADRYAAKYIVLLTICFAVISAFLTELPLLLITAYLFVHGFIRLCSWLDG